MVDPETIDDPEVNECDAAIANNRALHEFLTARRAKAFTRAYDRARKQAKVANRWQLPPTLDAKQSAPPATRSA